MKKTKSNATKEKKNFFRRFMWKHKENQAEEAIINPADIGYDGYYDDVIPVDYNSQKESIDKRLLWQIILIISVVAVIIGFCVVALYYL